MANCKWCGRKIGKHLNQETHSCRSKKLHERISNIEGKIVDYITNGYSLLYLSKNSEQMFGTKLSRNNLEYVCRWYSLPFPSLKDSANSKITREEYRKTVLEKYGVENVSQSCKIREKKDQTNMLRYGVTNPFQRSSVIEKSKSTMMDRYGVTNPIHLPRTNSNGRLSKPHKKISELLSSMGIDHINDALGLFSKHNEFLNRVYCPIPDIFIPEKHLVIEIFGTRWHMDPRIYQSTEVGVFFSGERTAQEIWDFDNIRINHIKSFDIEVEIIWESDIKSDWTKVVERIKKIYENC